MPPPKGYPTRIDDGALRIGRDSTRTTQNQSFAAVRHPSAPEMDTDGDHHIDIDEFV